MTETPTPSVEGDRLEEIAMIVRRAVETSALSQSGHMLDPTIATEAARQIDALPCKGGEAEQLVADFLKAADRLAADSWDGVDDLTRDLFEHAMNKAKWLATPTTEAAPEGKPVKMLVDGDWLSRKVASDPDLDVEAGLATTEPETGRGLREALEKIDQEATSAASRADAGYTINVATLVSIYKTARQALAALSDTPRGREGEGKQGLMASRDLRPTTVASSLKGSDVGEVKP